MNTATSIEPAREEVERTLEDLLSGRTSRGKVVSWVSERLSELDGEIQDPAVWMALSLLSGVTVQIGPDQYLHDDEQIAEWLEEFRAARRDEPSDAIVGLRAMRALTDELSYVVARERARPLAPGAVPAQKHVDRKPPTTTCHVLAVSESDALCGHPSEHLIEVAAVTTLDEVPVEHRCEDCAWRLRAGIA